MAGIEREPLKVHTGVIRQVLAQFREEGIGPGDHDWRQVFPTNPTEEQVLGELGRLDRENGGLLKF